LINTLNALTETEVGRTSVYFNYDKLLVGFSCTAK